MTASDITGGRAKYLGALQRLLEQPEPSSVFAIGAQVVPELVGPCIAEIIPLEELEGAYSDLRTTNQTSPNPSPLREVHRLLRNCGEEKDGWAVLGGSSVRPLPESVQTGSPIVACAIPIGSGESTYGTLVVARLTGAESFSPSEISLLESHARLMASAIAAADRTACLRHEVSVYAERDQELTATIQRWIDILDSCADLILAVDAEGAFVFCNQTWHEVLGYSPEQRSDMVLFDIIHPIHRERFHEIFRELLQGQIPALVETRFVTADGRTLDVEGQVRVVRRDGQFLHTVGIFRNVTERNRMQKDLAEVSARTKFLEGVHQTAVTLQHEINNPLTAMIGDLQLAELELRNDPLTAAVQVPEDLADRLQGIRAMARRIAETVKRLRELYEPVSSLHPVTPDEGVPMIDLTKSR